MGDAKPQPDAAKQRIITHMNADHQDSVVRYVEHLKGVSSSEARNAKLTEMDLDHLTISNGSTTWRIPLEPPMGSWREARERLVQMDADAVKALNRSNITITEYKPPKGLHAIIFGLCLLGYVSFARKENFVPGGSPMYEGVKYIPGLAELLVNTYPLALVLMVAIHVTEVAIFIPSRLKKHSVPTFSKVWWAWVVSTFVEGFGAFQRFDAAVKAKQAEKEKRNH